MNDELAVQSPSWQISRANEVASATAQIVKARTIKLGKEQYLKNDGWLSLAVAHGCVASARDVQKIEGGFRAIGEVKRIDNGVVIATAEGFCGDDEPNWAKKPEYARRSMAQTRATSKACKTAFAHCLLLIDPTISTTPADEVPAGGFEQEINTHKYEEKRVAVVAHVEGERTDWKSAVIPIGKNKGKTLGELSPKQITWYFEEYQPNPKYPDSMGLRKALDDWFAETSGDAQWKNVEVVKSGQEEDQIPF
jgi:hypothetical protein